MKACHKRAKSSTAVKFFARQAVWPLLLEEGTGDARPFVVVHDESAAQGCVEVVPVPARNIKFKSYSVSATTNTSHSTPTVPKA